MSEVGLADRSTVNLPVVERLFLAALAKGDKVVRKRGRRMDEAALEA